MKRVLVTGANGFIGKAVMDALYGSDWETIPLVRKSAGLPNEVIADLCNPDLGMALNSLQRIDAIVHFGAAIGWGDISREILFKTNVWATSELADWANKRGAYLLFASMATVCGAKNTSIKSDSKLNLDTDYAYSKWLAEEAIKRSNVKHAIMRIAGVFGRRGPYHLGINKAIDDALAGIPPIQHGDGGVKRNYIYVKDLAHIVKFCIENEIVGTHLIAGSRIDTVAEMLQTICDILLPGSRPERREGAKAYDQIIAHSEGLPRGRSFKEAIMDIKYNSKDISNKLSAAGR